MDFLPDQTYSIPAEQAILGAILIKPDTAMSKALDQLRGSEFYHNPHRRLYGVMQELSEEGIPIDLLTLANRLEKKGWLGSDLSVSYLSELYESTPTAENIDYYIDIVKGKFTHRQLILDLREQLDRAQSTSDPESVMEVTRTKLEAISDQSRMKKNFKVIKEILPDVFEELERKYLNKQNGAVTGITSGFTDLDRMTAGFQDSDFIVLAARPSVGKTAFALNVAENAAESTGETIAIFSLEMSEKQLVGRMICAEGHVDAGRFRTGHLLEEDWEKVTMALSKLSELSIIIDDTPAISVAEIRSQCRKIQREHGLGMILIDYLQLIGGRGKAGENRQEEVSFISRTLKQIARELNVPVIALSQLSRGVEQRQDKRPMMSDLRDSGAIEQDADIVAFLYRDDYYDKESEKKNIIEIIIAKQRNGPTGTVELAFLKQFNKFVNLDRSHHEAEWIKDKPKPKTNSNYGGRYQ